MSDRCYKIIAYLPGWKDWTVDTIDGNKLTHINFAFASIEDGVITCKHNEKLNELRNIKSKFSTLKTLISVGGWGAEGFSDAAFTEDARTKFADSAVEFMIKYGFDGIDLDWEFPCSPENYIKHRPEDKRNFTLLLKKMREKIDEKGKQNNKSYLLTIAAGALFEHIQNMELDIIHEYLDYINIMTYDFFNGFSTISGHVTNLYRSGLDKSLGLSADTAVQLFIKGGVPASKIVIGGAFYGRGCNVPCSNNKGLYEPIEGSGSEYAFTTLVYEYINKNGYIRYWDDSAKAPYLWNGTTLITYDDEESLSFKADYIKDLGLGGIMFWEYTQDSTGMLLNKLYKGLK